MGTAAARLCPSPHTAAGASGGAHDECAGTAAAAPGASQRRRRPQRHRRPPTAQRGGRRPMVPGPTPQPLRGPGAAVVAATPPLQRARYHRGCSPWPRSRARCDGRPHAHAVAGPHPGCGGSGGGTLAERERAGGPRMCGGGLRRGIEVVAPLPPTHHPHGGAGGALAVSRQRGQGAGQPRVARRSQRGIGRGHRAAEHWRRAFAGPRLRPRVGAVGITGCV